MGAVDMREDLISMTREQLQAERDAWYGNGIRNGRLRELAKWSRLMVGDRRVLGATTVRLIEESA